MNNLTKRFLGRSITFITQGRIRSQNKDCQNLNDLFMRYHKHRVLYKLLFNLHC
jgi:hypothetical protein